MFLGLSPNLCLHIFTGQKTEWKQKQTICEHETKTNWKAFGQE